MKVFASTESWALVKRRKKSPHWKPNMETVAGQNDKAEQKWEGKSNGSG